MLLKKLTCKKWRSVGNSKKRHKKRSSRVQDEKLEKVPKFTPSYAKCPQDMVYIMSMEYGRMWLKEKEEWFSQIFKAEPKEQDINIRRKKFRKEFLEAKKQAEIKIQERKERKKKEAEAKAKADAEAAEKARKMKAKLEKFVTKKKKKKKEIPPEPEKKDPTPEHRSETCPEGWKQVELTLQCECAQQKDCEKEPKIDLELKSADENEQIQQTCPQSCMEDQIVEAVDKMIRNEPYNKKADQSNNCYNQSLGSTN